MEKENLIEALKEYQRFNHIRNDLEAYLFNMAQWALGEDPEKPDPRYFGVPTQEDIDNYIRSKES